VYATKKKNCDEILNLIPDDSDLIIPLANGEPDAILTLIDEHPEHYASLRIHQMLELNERKYMQGLSPGITYFSYFMSQFARKNFQAGNCELVPNHFHQMPRLLQQRVKNPIVICQAAPMNEEGYFSLGTQADYAACFIGKAPFILQVNQAMPWTYGKNAVHISHVLGFVEKNAPLAEIAPSISTEKDQRIAEYVAERIENGSSIQVGIGGVPDAVVRLLAHHQDLGVHTEMLTDGLVELAKKGVINGKKKKTYPEKIVATFAWGSQKMYDFMDHNEVVEMLPVDVVNDPRVIAQESQMVAINSTTEIDFYGQCASETVAGKYYSSTGGQSDFGTGVRFAEHGKGFICLYSTAKEDTISRIRPFLTQGSAVTTSKNDVDFVVTEYGIAELKAKSISERVNALLSIAHPKFREELHFEAQRLGLLTKRQFVLGAFQSP
jgi:acyl-CoA hydrolase